MVETTEAKSVKPTSPHRRLIHWLVIVLVLCGLFPFLYYMALPLVVMTYLKWTSAGNISNAQEQGVNWVLTHGYPNATLVRADAQVSSWPAGDNVSVIVLVTLESVDPFESIRSWYIQHPEGGWGGSLAGGNIFPYEGLDKMEGAAPGKTRYRITYLNVALCVVDCDQPLHQIR